MGKNPHNQKPSFQGKVRKEQGNKMTSNTTTNNQNQSVDTIVVQGVSSFVSSNPNWVGTMTQLSRKISRTLSRSEKNYLPGSASALRKVINRNIRRIRSRGIAINFDRTPDRMRTRLVRIESSRQS